MRGRDFLDVSRHAVVGGREAYWRDAVVSAYYALFLECREALAAWGAALPPRHQAHNWVRLKLHYARDADLLKLGHLLEDLLKIRNRASYDLRPLVEFSSDTTAVQVIQRVDAAIQLLDSIEADPGRRAAAIASLPP
jgi:hypothetical protein